MKNLFAKIKNLKLDDIIKSSFIMIFAIISILVFFNQSEIQFLANGFGRIQRQDLQVYYLNVGQASATMIILPNKMSMIIDTGSQESTTDFMESVGIIMARNNLTLVDYLILTHSDEDHVGGVVALLKEYQIGTIYRPKIYSPNEDTSQIETEVKVVDTQIYQEVIDAVYQEKNCEVNFVENSSMKIGNDLFINIYACQKDTYTQTNAFSPFIVIDYLDKTFLFTGDATAEREEEFVDMLTNSNMTLEVDFLQVSHHGSKYNTTEEFLESINPKYAVVSAEYKNYPNLEVTERLNKNGVDGIFCTRADGMIAVGVNTDGNYVIKTTQVFVDLPFILVVMWCGIFVFSNIQFKNTNKRIKKKKFLESNLSIK